MWHWLGVCGTGDCRHPPLWRFVWNFSCQNKNSHFPFFSLLLPKYPQMRGWHTLCPWHDLMLWNFSVVICSDECWLPAELLWTLQVFVEVRALFLKALDSHVLFDVICDKQGCKKFRKCTEEEHCSFKCFFPIAFYKLTPEESGYKRNPL